MSKFKVGDRVQLAVWLDRWMRGDRYGEVVKLITSQTVRVQMDRSGDSIVVNVRDLREVE